MAWLTLQQLTRALYLYDTTYFPVCVCICVYSTLTIHIHMLYILKISGVHAMHSMS